MSRPDRRSRGRLAVFIAVVGLVIATAATWSRGPTQTARTSPVVSFAGHGILPAARLVRVTRASLTTGAHPAIARVVRPGPTAAGSAGTPQTAHDEAPSGGVTTVSETVQVGDITRNYLLGGAPVIPGLKAPLLLLWHGLDQETTDFLSEVDILTAAANAGVIVAAPESDDNSFNDGRFGPDGADDDDFATAIIAQLTANDAVDPNRVTVAGFSNGAGMSLELAARHPDAIAAMVSVDGEILSGSDQTLPSGPVPAFFIHGTDDQVQPSEGRLYENERYPGYISEADTIGSFLAVDGDAGSAPTRVVIAPSHRGAVVGPTTITQWAVPGSVPVTYAEVSGMGHKWPALVCGQLAVPSQLALKEATLKRTAVKVAAVRKLLSKRGVLRLPAGRRLAAQLVVLKRAYATETADVAKAVAASAQLESIQLTTVASMLPGSDVAGCATSSTPNTQVTDISASSLVVGVAATAYHGSYVS